MKDTSLTHTQATDQQIITCDYRYVIQGGSSSSSRGDCQVVLHGAALLPIGDDDWLELARHPLASGLPLT